ncbi:hypothetical protein C8J57DRAFT_1309087 [Mycena rebaudengoi]|nr:hypothetical protein C8J57DRAFT_1309087 [Mycena rebaudengoi]
MIRGCPSTKPFLRVEDQRSECGLSRAESIFISLLHVAAFWFPILLVSYSSDCFLGGWLAVISTSPGRLSSLRLLAYCICMSALYQRGHMNAPHTAR